MTITTTAASRRLEAAVRPMRARRQPVKELWYFFGGFWWLLEKRRGKRNNDWNVYRATEREGVHEDVLCILTFPVEAAYPDTAQVMDALNAYDMRWNAHRIMGDDAPLLAPTPHEAVAIALHWSRTVKANVERERDRLVEQLADCQGRLRAVTHEIHVLRTVRV